MLSASSARFERRAFQITPRGAPPPSRIRKNLPAHQAHWYVLSTPPSTTRDFLDKTIKQTPSHVVDREITTSSLQSHRFRSVCPLLIGRFCRKLEIHPRGRYLLLLRSNSVLVLYIYGMGTSTRQKSYQVLRSINQVYRH